MIQFAPEPHGREAFDAFWRSLLTSDWEQLDGPLRLNAELALSDLVKADFLINARLFLAALAEQDGAPTTATGNLSRVFAGVMLDRLRLARPYRDSVRSVCKVINEQDV